jgi:hypothetical protein
VDSASLVSVGDAAAAASREAIVATSVAEASSAAGSAGSSASGTSEEDASASTNNDERGLVDSGGGGGDGPATSDGASGRSALGKDEDQPEKKGEEDEDGGREEKAPSASGAEAPEEGRGRREVHRVRSRDRWHSHDKDERNRERERERDRDDRDLKDGRWDPKDRDRHVYTTEHVDPGRRGDDQRHKDRKGTDKGDRRRTPSPERLSMSEHPRHARTRRSRSRSRPRTFRSNSRSRPRARSRSRSRSQPRPGGDRTGDVRRHSLSPRRLRSSDAKTGDPSRQDSSRTGGHGTVVDRSPRSDAGSSSRSEGRGWITHDVLEARTAEFLTASRISHRGPERPTEAELIHRLATWAEDGRRAMAVTMMTAATATPSFSSPARGAGHIHGSSGGSGTASTDGAGSSASGGVGAAPGSAPKESQVLWFHLISLRDLCNHAEATASAHRDHGARKRREEWWDREDPHPVRRLHPPHWIPETSGAWREFPPALSVLMDTVAMSIGFIIDNYQERFKRLCHCREALLAKFTMLSFFKTTIVDLLDSIRTAATTCDIMYKSHDRGRWRPFRLPSRELFEDGALLCIGKCDSVPGLRLPDGKSVSKFSWFDHEGSEIKTMDSIMTSLLSDGDIRLMTLRLIHIRIRAMTTTCQDLSYVLWDQYMGLRECEAATFREAIELYAEDRRSGGLSSVLERIARRLAEILDICHRLLDPRACSCAAVAATGAHEGAGGGERDGLRVKRPRTVLLPTDRVVVVTDPVSRMAEKAGEVGGGGGRSQAGGSATKAKSERRRAGRDDRDGAHRTHGDGGGRHRETSASSKPETKWGVLTISAPSDPLDRGHRTVSAATPGRTSVLAPAPAPAPSLAASTVARETGRLAAARDGAARDSEPVVSAPAASSADSTPRAGVVLTAPTKKESTAAGSAEKESSLFRRENTRGSDGRRDPGKGVGADTKPTNKRDPGKDGVGGGSGSTPAVLPAPVSEPSSVGSGDTATSSTRLSRATFGGGPRARSAATPAPPPPQPDLVVTLVSSAPTPAPVLLKSSGSDPVAPVRLAVPAVTAPDMGSRICGRFLRGKCSSLSCARAHVPPCPRFASTGSCELGNACSMPHVPR